MTDAESIEELKARLNLATGQVARLRQAMLDIGVQANIVDLIQNFGAKITVEKTEEP